MALKEHPNGLVHGCLFTSYGKKQMNLLIKSFLQRETPSHPNGTIMDIYEYDFVEIIHPDGQTKEYALTCLMNKKSLFYLNKPLTIEEQAFKIAQAYGINGTNVQYLEKLIHIYQILNIKDSFTDDFEDLLVKLENFVQVLQYMIKNGLLFMINYNI